ncbi:hypothetical protein BO443_160021 [Burkholderia orbicola]
MSAIREKINISERRACRLVGLSRGVLHYDAKPDHENEVLAARLVELAHERRRFGYVDCTPWWNAKARTPITSASIACTVRQGRLCGAVTSARAS